MSLFINMRGWLSFFMSDESFRYGTSRDISPCKDDNGLMEFLFVHGWGGFSKKPIKNKEHPIYKMYVEIDGMVRANAGGLIFIRDRGILKHDLVPPCGHFEPEITLCRLADRPCGLVYDIQEGRVLFPIVRYVRGRTSFGCIVEDSCVSGGYEDFQHPFACVYEPELENVSAFIRRTSETRKLCSILGIGYRDILRRNSRLNAMEDLHTRLRRFEPVYK